MFGIDTVSFEMVLGHIHLHIFDTVKWAYLSMPTYLSMPSVAIFPKNDYGLSKAFKFLNIIPLTTPPGMTVLNIG